MTVFDVVKQRQTFLMSFIHQCVNLTSITQMKRHFDTRASLEQQN